jgi:pyruvate formate lyase activating enzyme
VSTSRSADVSADPGAGMEWRPAAFQRRSARGLTCTLCPFGCELGDGDTGRCHVRRRRGDRIETATFATAAWHLQPIERKPFYHVRPGSRVLTVAAPGCMFRCTYCQNFRISQVGRDPRAGWQARPLAPADLVAAARDAGAAIAFSYSEPVLAAELTLAAAAGARAAGIPVLWKTNGFASTEAALRLATALDAACVDLKHVDDAAHRRLTGAPVRPVLDTLATWRAAGLWLEIATPLIPGFNTDPTTLRALARHVRALGPDTPWHLLRFHPDYRLQDAPPTHPELLAMARDIARDEGLAHVYVERALGEDARHTRCPGCGDVLVQRDFDSGLGDGLGRGDGGPGRDRWRIRAAGLQNGRCARCHRPIPGRWEAS